MSKYTLTLLNSFISKVTVKRLYVFSEALAFISGLISIFALMNPMQGEDPVIYVENTQVISGYGQIFILGLTGILAALIIALTTNILDKLPELSPFPVSQTRWDCSWIPLLTTSSLLMGDGIAFTLFLDSNERTKEQDAVIIWPYLFLFFLSLITLFLFVIQLDHLAAIFIAVFSNSMGLMLVCYEDYGYDNPFRGIGAVLSIWALIAVLLNFSPPIIRASRNAFILAPMAKHKLTKTGLIVGTVIGSLPAFNITKSTLKQTSISEETLLFVTWPFWLVILPIILVFLVAFAHRLRGTYPETALDIKSWLKVILATLFLSWFVISIALQGVIRHNVWL